MSKIIKYMPELQDEEQLHVASLFKDLSEEQAEQFSRIYRQRRKETNITLVTALLGFLTVAGVHRFYLGQIGMGLLYLFTGGLCAIGTIVDAFNYKRLTYQFNEKQAIDVLGLVRGAFPETPRLEGGAGEGDD